MRLPLLQQQPDAVDRVEIQTPCTVSWDSMYGDDQVRHCGQCRQNVYNVAALSRADALRLITGRERACLRIYRRPDGTVVTADCWSRLRAARRRGMWAFIGMLVVIGWAELAAILVGVAGLRRVTGGPTLGGVRPAAVTPTPARPSPPRPPGYLMGTPPILDEVLGEVAPAPQEWLGKLARPPKHTARRHPDPDREVRMGRVRRP